MKHQGVITESDTKPLQIDVELGTLTDHRIVFRSQERFGADYEIFDDSGASLGGRPFYNRTYLNEGLIGDLNVLLEESNHRLSRANFASISAQVQGYYNRRYREEVPGGEVVVTFI
ncbi:MAG: hypothetical protein ACK4SL_02145 [Candidatus Paceibacteria bacterium]